MQSNPANAKRCLFLLLAILFASSSRASAQEFHYPLKPAAANGGPVYVADLKLPGIVAIKNGRVEKFFTAEKKIGSPLYRVRAIAVAGDGTVFAADTSTRQVYRFDKGGKPVPLLAKFPGGIGIPISLVVNKAGALLIADLETGAIWKLLAGADLPTRFASVAVPRGMALDAQERLWVVSGSKDQLLRVSPDGKAEVVVSGQPFQYPNDVALDPSGTAYVSDGYAKTIWKIDSAGKPTAWISGVPLVNPVGLCWHQESLVIADPDPRTNTGKIYRADAAGKLTPLVGK